MSSLLKRGLGSLACMLAASIVVSSGCSATPKGSLMVSISTDMQTPKDVDVVSLFVATDGVAKFDYLGRVLPDGTLSLPSTLALVQPDNPNAQVHIRVTAFQTQGTQENARVLRDVLTTVPTAGTALLRLPLDFLDDGSGQGTLPAQYVPEGVDSAPDGLTPFDPTTTIGSSCDPMQLCKTGSANCLTMVNGVCGPATVNSSMLPAFTQSEVFGDGGLMASGAPESCFNVEICFAGATPVTSVNGQGTQACSFMLPSATSPSTLNVALVTPSAGACLASGCYVPLPDDPNEGFTVQGSTVTLAPGVCNKLGNTVMLAVSSGACPTETLSEPVCEPTTPAEVAEAGLPVPGDATSECEGEACSPADAGDATVADAAAPDAQDATLSDATVSDASSPLCGFPSLLYALAGQWSGACGSSVVSWTIAADGTYSQISTNGQYGSGTISSDGSFTATGGGGGFGNLTANGVIALGSSCDSFTENYNYQLPPGPAVPAPYANSCPASRVCPTGTTLCGTSCVSTQSDPNNCGECGMACTSSSPFCAEAACGQNPPSCAPGGAGMSDCGPGGSGAESCCTSLDVPGGTYFRTYTDDADGATGEADPATVSGLRLDEYSVTVGRFRQFVNAVLPPDGGAGWLPAAGSGKHTHLNGGQGLAAGPDVDAGQTYEPGWSASDDSSVAPTNANLACTSPMAGFATWTITPGSQENLPINCVTWQEAYAFCIWDGGFLPSEAEWEYAAAGGSEQLEYPWGTTDPGTGNQYAIYMCEYPSGLGTCTGVTNIAPVGTATLGAGLWGQLDLAGNMWQWTLDWYASSYLDPCVDCGNLTTPSYRVPRGGYFGSDSTSYLSPPNRNGSPAVRDYSVGLRCARTP
jgi:formylglycine-generating enzyme